MTFEPEATGAAVDGFDDATIADGVTDVPLRQDLAMTGAIDGRLRTSDSRHWPG